MREAPDSQDGLPDELLLQKSRSGDVAAFGVLVDRYQDLVFRVVRRTARVNVETAEDLAQDTFLRAFRGLPQFRGECRFVHWLLRIAHNAVINRGTSMSVRFEQKMNSIHSSRTGHDDDRGMDPVDGLAESPAAGVERAELKEVLGRALERLPDEFRAAVVLRDIEGLEYEEISLILSVPLGTVRSRIHRGREALKDIVARAFKGARTGFELRGNEA